MFGEAGRAYVYYGYGRHFCVNVFARSSKIQGGAVLNTSLEPLEGPSLHEKHRNNSKDLLLISGQGRLSQALSICRSINGIDMTDTTCDLPLNSVLSSKA